MALRPRNPAVSLRAWTLAAHATTATPPPALAPFLARAAGSLSQRPDSKFVSFPGAVKSAFTNQLKFELPSEYPALPTYRVLDQDGSVVDPSFQPDLADADVAKLYRDMLTVSIMDIIMFDAQRQGRISFYMVSAGEEAVCVGSASALAKEDVVFCQYREQGVFQQRGFAMKDFMSQLFANKNDAGRGRNMPVHYGSRKLNIVRVVTGERPVPGQMADGTYAAHNLVHLGDADPARLGRGVCPQDPAHAGPVGAAQSRGRVLWRGRRQ